MTGATVKCRGGEFKYIFDPAQTPTWWSFQDENHIRERWWHIEPGDVVLDVGADLGSYTLPALAAGASRCYTWSIHWLDLFFGNISANNWEDKVVINGYGLWSKGGWLSSPPDLAPLVFSRTNLIKDSFRVDTLDDAASFLNITKADWLKIDIEGAEVEMLKGAERTITSLKPKILIEYHEFKDKNIIAKCRYILKEYGYTEIGREERHAFYIP